jgi:hypothetical protein
MHFVLPAKEQNRTQRHALQVVSYRVIMVSYRVIMVSYRVIRSVTGALWSVTGALLVGETIKCFKISRRRRRRH